MVDEVLTHDHIVKTMEGIKTAIDTHIMAIKAMHEVPETKPGDPAGKPVGMPPSLAAITVAHTKLDKITAEMAEAILPIVHVPHAHHH